jgi:alkylhydroperoxidase/carboxymuconolactone decarboxylase family protein YurZ
VAASQLGDHFMSEPNENIPPFLMPLFQSDAALYDLVTKSMQQCLPETGVIPLKYRLLLSMVADGVLFHPEGVTALANSARQAGASEEEINEAMRVIYLSGGMVALVNSLGAYKK